MAAGARGLLRRRRPHGVRQGRAEGRLLADARRRHGRQGRPRAAAPQPADPPERIGDVIMAATAQVGDQGLTLGRDVALLAGLPQTVPGFAVDRMCAGALTAVTAGAGEIAMGAADVVLAGGVEHMGHHPMGEDVDFNPRFVAERLVDESAATMGATAENLHDRFPQLTKEDADRFAVASQQKRGRRLAERRHARDRRADERLHRRRLARRRPRRVPAPGHDARGPRGPAHAVPRRRPRHRRQLGRAHRRRHGRLLASAEAPRSSASSRDAPRRFAFAGVEPELMGIGPVPATQRVLEQAGPHARRRRPLRAERAVRRPGAHLVRRARRRRRTTSGSTRTAARSRAATRSRRPACG